MKTIDPHPRKKYLPKLPLYACFTLDFELDYGGRVKAFDTLKERQGHLHLKKILEQHGAPLSAFVQTSVLKSFPESKDVLKLLADEVHSHSHSHASNHFQSKEELERSLSILESTFSQKAYGYRAPYGKLYPNDLDLIQSLGYAFDSSVFPSIRPGKFNNLSSPIEPWYWDNGLLELPFGVLPYARLILGISYLKLLGPNFYQMLMKLTGLPRVLMFYGHMHDFFPTSAVQTFSPALKFAFGRNGHRPMEITDTFLGNLKERGYTFLTVNELVEKLRQENIP